MISRSTVGIRFTFILFPLLALSACGTQLEPSTVVVDGRRVEVVEAGDGAATVVFEAGFGDDWTPWDDVASLVEPHARIFAYSRPGYGASQSSDTARDAAHIVAELRALLVARGYEPPYVLVGHSFGGTYMEYFAKAHPDEVAALVLVDPRHRRFTDACAEAGLEGYTIPASMVATLPRVQREEFEGFEASVGVIDGLGPFGSYPVRVLTATSHPWAGAVEAMWQSMLGELAGEAEDGAQVIYRGAGHYLQVERPREVAAEILSLLPVE